MMALQDGADLCFPELLNSSCRKLKHHGSEAVLLNVSYFISPITVALNLLIIISVSHFRQLHTPTNILLISLAVSDFLVGLVLMPGEIYRYRSCWFLGDIVCALYCYLVCQTVSASVGSIVLISVDRYVAICHPLHYSSRITVNRSKCCVCLCWVSSAFLNVFYVRNELIQPGRSNSCAGECTFVTDYATGTVDIIFNFVFPVTIIIALYMRVFVVAVSQARAMHSRITAVPVHQAVILSSRKSELKAARTLGVLVVVYLSCFCPYYCYYLVEINVTSTTFSTFLLFTLYFNSSLNPLIYAVLYPWFRKAIKLILTLQILQPGSRETNIV